MASPSGVDEQGEPASVLSDELVGERVVLGGAQRAIGFGIASALTAASAIILLRYLKVANLGRYGTVLALVGIIYGISEMGLTATGTRELALSKTVAARREVLAHILGLRIVVTSIGIVLAILFAMLAGYPAEMVVGTAIAGFGTLLQSLQAAMLMPLSVDLRNGALALNQILTQAVLFGGFVALAAIGAGLVPFFGVQVLMGVVLLAVTPLMVSRRQLVAPLWTPARLYALGRTALPLAMATVLTVLYLRVIVIVMSLLSGKPAQVGYFVTSTRVLEVIGGLPFLVVSLVLPVLSVAARDNHERLVYMTSRIAQTMVLAGVLVALVLWSLSTWLVTVMGGPEYRPAGSVLEIQGFATITVFLTAAFQASLMGMHRMRALVTSMAIGIVTVTVAGVILTPTFQAKGGAVAVVIGDVVLCLAVFTAVRRSGPGDWFPIGTAFRIAASGAIAIVVGLIPGLSALPRASAVAVSFVLAALVLGAVPSELTDALRRAIRGRTSRGE